MTDLTDKPDTYAGTNLDDIINGLGGADVIHGQGGKDQIDGGADNDKVFGDAGDDTLWGRDGDDILDGGSENDHLFGGTGADRLIGGDGDDILESGSGNDTLQGGAGQDWLMIGGAKTDSVYADGGDGDDRIDAIDGTFTRLNGGTGVDSLSVGGIVLDTFNKNSAFEVLLHGGTMTGTDAVTSYDFSTLSDSAAGGGMVLNGMGGADVMTGTNQADEINGGADNDVLHGRGGRDYLHGDAGNDTVYGDAGDDAINGGADNDTLYGGTENDTIEGAAGDDVISGDAGDDWISDYGGGHNVLKGGDGNDHVAVGGVAGATNEVDAGAGDDVVTIDGGVYSVLQGGTGTDTLLLHTAVLEGFSTANGFETFGDLFAVTGTAGSNVLDFGGLVASDPTRIYGVGVDGAAGDDTITGTALRDSLAGGADDDVIYGGGGFDAINGDGGNDELHGGDDTDIITDYFGSNRIFGDAGDDTINLGAGNNLVDGGAGNDTINGYSGASTLLGGDGSDIISSQGNDAVDGGAGDDAVTLAGYMTQRTGLVGGSGVDTLTIGPNVVFHQLDAAGSQFERLNLAGNLFGTEGADSIDLSGFQLIDGHAEVDGGLGNDHVIGTAANDLLYGRAGDDVLEGGAGNDTLDGGDEPGGSGTAAAGSDIASYEHAAAAVTVDLSLNGVAQDTKGAGVDTLIRMEGVIGSAYDDVLKGSVYNDTMIGGAGKDTISGGDGFDTIQGGDGNDVLDGGFEADTIDGGDGDDVIRAGGIQRASGPVRPGAVATDSVEHLIGGAGADTYVYANKVDLGVYQVPTNSGSLRGDAIVGITSEIAFRGNEGDRIDLSAMGLVWRGEGRMAGTRPQANYTIDATGTTIAIDTDGDGTVNAQLHLDRGVELVSTNGVLSGTEITLGTEQVDYLTGTDGNDAIRALGGNDQIEGGLGDDRINGGDGDDIVSYEHASAGIAASLRPATPGAQVVIDTGAVAGRDTLTSVEGLRGTGFGDHLVAAYGTHIEGGGGNDVIQGAGGVYLDGGAGADTYVFKVGETDWGRNSVHGHTTSATKAMAIVMDASDAIDLSDFGALSFIGNGAFTGQAGQLHWAIEGDHTNVEIDLNGDGKADDIIRVRGGQAMHYDAATHLVSTSSDPVQVLTGTDATDVLKGGDWNDTIYGAGARDVLYGGGGHDVLYGDAGNDTLYGGAGDDSLLGGNDADYLSGGTGADVMIGGAGADAYEVDNTGDQVIEGADALDGSAARPQDIVYASIDYTLTDNVERLTLTGAATQGHGNALGNVLTAGDGGATLWGMGGNDQLIGGAGHDTLYGGAGNDSYYVDGTGDMVIENAGEGTDRVYSGGDYTLGANVENLTLTGSALHGTGNEANNVITGNDGANILYGNGGNDTLNGGGGIDWLYGGAGNDTVDGGAGADNLAGGAGQDTFREWLAQDADKDAILDFQGGDLLDLSGMDAKGGTNAANAFTLLGNGAFTHQAGELHVQTSGDATIVSGDIDGDAVADFAFTVHTDHALVASDFVL